MVLVAAAAVARASIEDIAKAESETQAAPLGAGAGAEVRGRKAQLQQRVTLIEQLRKGQTGPVHLLDQISKQPARPAVADRAEADGQRLHDRRLADVADRVCPTSSRTSKATKWFKRPVEIVDSQVQSDAKTGDLVKFSIKAQFDDPEAPRRPPAPRPSRPTARTAAK